MPLLDNHPYHYNPFRLQLSALWDVVVTGSWHSFDNKSIRNPIWLNFLLCFPIINVPIAGYIQHYAHKAMRKFLFTWTDVPALDFVDLFKDSTWWVNENKKQTIGEPTYVL